MSYLHPLALISIGAASAYFAKKRGKNPLLWFFLGVLFGVFGLLFLLLSQSAPSPKQARFRAEQDPTVIDITPKVEPAAKSAFWYYLEPDRSQKGPLSYEGLIRAFKEGKLSAGSYVWNETLENWRPLSDFL